MTVNKERMELWAQALESEGYTQCRGNLRFYDLFKQPMHCAEGVAMEVAKAHGVKITQEQWGWASMPPQVREWYGLPGQAVVIHEELAMSVVNANDSVGLPFWDIAQLLRAKYLKEEGQ